MNAISKNYKEDSSSELSKYTNQYIKKVTDNLSNFSYNVLIANLYEMYSFLNKEISNIYTSKTLRENYNKILITMLPIIPHLATECLKMNNFEVNQNWPTYDEKMLLNKLVNVVVQINGKKRDLIEVKRDTSEDELLIYIKKRENLKKYLNNNNFKKTIFVKNKIINLII